MSTYENATNKRPALAQPSSGADEPVTKPFVETLIHEAVDKGFVDQEAKTRELIQGTLQHFSSGFQKQSAELHSKVEERITSLDGRMCNVEAHVESQVQTNAQVAKHVLELQERTNNLENQLKIANKSAIAREDLQNDAFERPPNLEIIRVNAHRYVAKREVLDALTPWLAEVGIAPEQFILEGKAPQGKYFVVKFLLNPLSAARFVEAALANLKDKDGNWRAINVKLVNQQSEKLHIGSDESPKVRTMRRMAACIKKSIADLYPKIPIDDVHFKFHKSSVYAGRVGICCVEPTSGDVERKFFLWNYPGLAELEINKDALLDKTMRYLLRPEENIHWCL